MTLPNVDTIKTHITRVADAAAAITTRSAEHADQAVTEPPSSPPGPTPPDGGEDGA